MLPKMLSRGVLLLPEWEEEEGANGEIFGTTTRVGKTSTYWAIWARTVDPTTGMLRVCRGFMWEISSF